MVRGARAIAVVLLAVMVAAWLFQSGGRDGDRSTSEPMPAVMRVEPIMDAQFGNDAKRPVVKRTRRAEPGDGSDESAVEVDTSAWAARLAARGARRDLDAMAETFEESMECQSYHNAILAIREYDEILNDQYMTEADTEKLRELGEALVRIQSTIERAKPLCEGSDGIAVERAYHDSMLNAALLGDPDAQACFVAGGPQTQTWDLPEHRMFYATQFERYVPILTQAALERADPYVARNALYRFIATDVFSSIPLANPYLTWRAARLASLRGNPEMRSLIEGDLAMMSGQGVISANDIARADAWAQATYEQEFSGQPAVDFNNPGPCWPQAWR